MQTSSRTCSSRRPAWASARSSCPSAPGSAIPVSTSTTPLPAAIANAFTCGTPVQGSGSRSRQIPGWIRSARPSSRFFGLILGSCASRPPWTHPLGIFDRCNGQGIGQMGHAPKTAASLHELRSRIERGRYEVKPDRVAEAMLRRGHQVRPAASSSTPGLRFQPGSSARLAPASASANGVRPLTVVPRPVVAPDGVVVGDRPAARLRSRSDTAALIASHCSISPPRRRRARAR